MLFSKVLIGTTLLSACSNGRQSDCGSTATAILTSPNYTGGQSGLLGGFVTLDASDSSKNACAAVIDVTRYDASKRVWFINAWTSSHCSLGFETENRSAQLSVFRNGGYDRVTAYSNEEIAYASLYSDLSGAAGPQPYPSVFHLLRYLWLDASTNKEQLQLECQAGKLTSVFCATLSDTKVWDMALSETNGEAVKTDLKKVLESALSARQKVRDAAGGARGTLGAAYRISQGLIERSRYESMLSYAPMVEFWLICNSQQVRDSFVNSTASDLEIFAVNRENASDPDLRNWDVKVGKSNKSQDYSRADLTKSCNVAPKIAESLKSIRLFENKASVWDEARDSGVLDGDAPKPGAKLYQFTKWIVDKEKNKRKELVQNWKSLAPQIFSSGSPQGVFVHTNFEPRPNGNLEGQADTAKYQFSIFPLNNKLFAEKAPTVLTTGFKVKTTPTDQIGFVPGDSGSLFSMNGSIPLMSLHSEGDKVTSGGIAAIPLPQKSAASSAGSSASGSPNSTTTERAPNSKSGQETSVALPGAEETPSAGLLGCQ